MRDGYLHALQHCQGRISPVAPVHHAPHYPVKTMALMIDFLLKPEYPYFGYKKVGTRINASETI